MVYLLSGGWEEGEGEREGGGTPGGGLFWSSTAAAVFVFSYQYQIEGIDAVSIL